MDDITTEQKLQLVQQIRRQYHRNQYDMSNRERILYGCTTKPILQVTEKSYHYKEQASPIAHSEAKIISVFFRIRCILAVMLFVFIVLFDFLNIKPMGLDMQRVFNAITTDYKEDVAEFAETISTTTKNSP